MRITFIPLILIFYSSCVLSLTLDQKLDAIKKIYSLEDKSCESRRQTIRTDLIEVGEALFNTKDLSGDRDTSCSTCHIDEKHLTDGLSVSAGVGGDGESHDRLKSGGIIVPRNSFTLFSRAHKEFRAYFWDGKIEIDETGKIYSPFGDDLDQTFISQLAVASTLPLLARDEFLGTVSFFEDNDHVYHINDEFYQDRYEAASELIRNLIRKASSEEIKRIRNLFTEADVNPETLSLADIGNAISSFIASELSCRHKSDWNQYLSGKLDSISDKAKEGAVLFYGSARCGNCHSGNLLSDFQYHSIAAPQGYFGTSPLGQDLGRAEVTHNVGDRYKFRTPPLVGVSNTAPYGHSGQFEDLESIILHHINPMLFMTNYKWNSEHEMMQYGKILGQRAQVLTMHDVNDINSVRLIIEFLKTL